MMKRVAMIAGALLLASCAPSSETATDSGEGVIRTAEACTARGGDWRPVGRLQTPSCVLSYADAGNICRDSDDCEGECRYAGEEALQAGQAVTGQCQVNSDRFGCFTRVEDGKAEPTLCID